MTPLTNEQRLEAYKWALENFRTLTHKPFLCLALDEWIANNTTLSIIWDTEKYFPEMEKRKPNPEDNSWFPCSPTGIAQREALLKECIAEVEELIARTPVVNKNSTHWTND